MANQYCFERMGGSREDEYCSFTLLGVEGVMYFETLNLYGNMESVMDPSSNYYHPSYCNYLQHERSGMAWSGDDSHYSFEPRYGTSENPKIFVKSGDVFDYIGNRQLSSAGAGFRVCVAHCSQECLIGEGCNHVGFSGSLRTGECRDCEIDSYSDFHDHFNPCKKCGEHRTTVATHSTKVDDCVCKQGYYRWERGGFQLSKHWSVKREELPAYPPAQSERFFFGVFCNLTFLVYIAHCLLLLSAPLRSTNILLLATTMIARPVQRTRLEAK